MRRSVTEAGYGCGRTGTSGRYVTFKPHVAVVACQGRRQVAGGKGVSGVKDGVRLLTKQDWKAIGDPILHIELRRWADLVVIAPCSADMLAKIAAGFSDNLAVSDGPRRSQGLKGE